MTLQHRGMSSSQLIILGFALTITIGALLLSLPCANVTGKPASLGDAIFTATSAVCVTGLVVQDTSTYWTVFGQVVILCLIQIGGLGVVTMSVAISMLS
ncbi:MAG: Trk family potassium uptake protein, partial [Sphaerochaetaceae bacterium]